MAQKRRWNYLDDDATKDINRWLTGIINPGLYFGFDFNPTANMNLNLNHNTTGFKDVDDAEAESGFQSLLVTRQGTVVKEDNAITINSIANGDATNPRIDIVVCTHTYSEIAGGTQALYSVIQGTPAGSPVAPAVANALTQIKIGELLIPANTTALNQGGVTWTRNNIFGTVGGVVGAASTVVLSNLTADRVTVSNSLGKISASAITTTQLNQLAGINTGQTIQSQIDGKQATITGAITTVLTSNLSNNVVVVSNGSGKVISGSVTVAELGVLAGVTGITSTNLNHLSGSTGNIQTQINGKQDTITGAITTVLTSNLTANRVVVSNGSGKVIASSILDSELNQLSGIDGPVLAGAAGQPRLETKILDIIDWDFDTDDTKNITHGLTDSNIVFVSGWIRPDDNALPYYQLNAITNQSPDSNGVYVVNWSSGSVTLRVSSDFVPGGFFDQTGGYKRGEIIIFYKA